MKQFKQYIAEAGGHMTHIEDSVIYGGVDGARDAINALRSLRDMINGSTKSPKNLSVKWDGAPAVFMGLDPSDGKFFVSKKGIFNKNPKVYKSVEDVKADTTGDLAEKLIAAFEECSKLGVKGIIQGDIMYTKKDLKKQTIDGEEFVVFHPNTIAYAVPVKSDLGKKILKSKIGIVFHTSYSGDSFENLKATFDVDTSTMKKIPAVWYMEAQLRDLSGRATLTAAETQKLDDLLSKAGVIFNQISSSTLKQIQANPTLAQNLETFNNTFVRKGESIGDSATHVKKLIQWVHGKFDKDKESKKSEKGKADVDAKRAAYMAFFSDENKASLIKLYELQKLIVEAKLMIIDKLEELKAIKTFVKTADGFKVTKDEGYVVVDHLKGGALKVVDRLEFSFANFDPSIIKGWEH